MLTTANKIIATTTHLAELGLLANRNEPVERLWQQGVSALRVAQRELGRSNINTTTTTRETFQLWEALDGSIGEIELFFRNADDGDISFVWTNSQRLGEQLGVLQGLAAVIAKNIAGLN